MAKNVTKIVLNLRDRRSLEDAQKRVRRAKLYYENEKFLFDQIGQEAERRFIRPLMRNIRRYPPESRYPNDYPLEWKSEKQHRYVMWLLGGRRYVRTYGLKRGWGYHIKSNRGKLSFSITQDAPYYKFVVGEFGFGTSRRSVQRYVKPQQPFHAHNIRGKKRWKLAYGMIQDTQRSIEELAQNKLALWLEAGMNQ